MSTKTKETVEPKAQKTEGSVRLKYIGRKKDLKYVCFKGTCFELVNGVFEVPVSVVKAFLADGNSKAFKVEKD